MMIMHILKIIKIKARWIDGFRCYIKHFGFEILPQGLYSTVDLDVEGWVDGLVVYHEDKWIYML